MRTHLWRWQVEGASRWTKSRSLFSAGVLSVLGVLSGIVGCGDDEDEPPTRATAGSGGTTSEGKGGLGGTTAAAGSGGIARGGTSGGGGETAAGSAGESGTAGMGGQPPVDGKAVFRFETFRDEAFWTDQLKMHEVVEKLDPKTALSVGLKVDSEAVPAEVLANADLNDPKTTLALLELNAVVGVRAKVQGSKLASLGITCALCHSDVDDSVMPGIGKRLDGYANRDLDPGKIIALSPALPESAKTVLNSWGKGKYDARWNQDGKNDPVLIPPIYGLASVPLETYTGDGPVSYWNAYVAVTQMGGQGQFFDPRINVRVIRTPDVVTPLLPSLYDYQISLAAPKPGTDTFDAAKATIGKSLFEGKAKCSTCHSGPAFTDAAERLHAPAATGMDPVAAERSATGKYRSTPLRALALHPPYFHNGSAATLRDVVDHYNTKLGLSLDTDEKSAIVEYLKSL